MSRRYISVCCAAVAGASIPETLRSGAEEHGIFMGTCINKGKLSTSDYADLAIAQYNLATAENACKWDAVEPNQGQFTFENCDKIRDFAKNEMKGTFRGHTLCWGNQLPNWVAGLNADQKRAAIKSHGKAIVSHYGDDAYAWDVVNEAVTDDNSATDILKDNAWYPEVPDYIDVAFQAADEARQAGGYKVKLFYNDYGADSTSDKKSERVYQLVKSMKERGIPIDGVGLQMHIGTWADGDWYYDGLKAHMQRLGDLGLEVHITELDIGFDSWGSRQETQQANMYKRILEVCLEVEACKSFETWGFTDSSTWKTGQHPLPFDENYQKKAAVDAMLSAFGAVESDTVAV